MDDYKDQGHMSSVVEENDHGEPVGYFLPHQAVIRPESETTKLRVVFDASAKTTYGTTLNDKLLAGPNLQRALNDIILRFRMHEYVLTADVAMMFRQILVDKKDRIYQRILWRRSPEEQVQTFELNTVTYGTACAPYLALKCLMQLAEEEGMDLPLAARSLREDCYMDDVLSGCDSLTTAIELQRQLSDLLKRGQFHLRKWRTNEPRVLQHLEEGCKTERMLVLNKEEALKTLGLYWNATLDCLQYHVKQDTTVETKRGILSRLAQVFDPLGLIAPLLVRGKLIMRRLWELDLGWDQVIPEELKTAWETYCADLREINELQVPRRVVYGNNSRFDIFGFGDASERAFGACLYA
ncbi:PREDICTED: uncharacterized protein LOC105567040, partial [Vollenhovia emeryi]|uniref:uncharacterized protein LOC105567040 n=1 Tax=Vollenhovia emeryi TaxID=411798 RepID=UPI0005F3D778